MEQPVPGTPEVSQQPPATGIAGIVEQSKAPQVTQTAQSGQAAQQKAPEYTPEQVAQWRAQAEQATKLDEQYKNLQADYTRKAQALAQLAGAQQQHQPQDPYAPFVEMAKKKGFDEESARAVAEMSDQIAQQRTNQAMQEFQYLNAGTQLPSILQQAYNLAPSALQNPKVQEALRNEMQGYINNRQFQYLDPEFAANRAKILAFDQGLFVPGQQVQPQPQQQNISSIYGIPQGFGGAPKQEPNKIDSPVTQQVVNDLGARYKGMTIK